MSSIQKFRIKNIPINYEVIRTLTEKYYDENSIDSIKVTKYFPRRFVSRNNLKYITLSGETASADNSKINDFKEKLNIHSIGNVFNIDETRIFIESNFRKSFVLEK